MVNRENAYDEDIVVITNCTEMLSRLDELENSIPIRVQREVPKEVRLQLDNQLHGLRHFKNQLMNQVLNVQVKVEGMRGRSEKVEEQVNNFSESLAALEEQMGHGQETTRNLVRMLRDIVNPFYRQQQSRPSGSVGKAPAESPASQKDPLSQQSFPGPPNLGPTPSSTPPPYETEVCGRKRKYPPKKCPHCQKELSKKYLSTHIRAHCKRIPRP